MKFNNCLFLCLVILECLHHRHHAFSLDNQALTEENNDQETKTEDVEESTDAGGVEEVDCESQAKKGECQTNYDMWNTCTPNCVKHSKDTWKNCPTLAYNERCISRSLEMRRDMHINCPETCGYAIAWNFKHREFMKLDKFATVDTALGDEPCAPPRGILATADIMRDRLLLYISGGVDVVKGMNHAWIPDDFLVFYGLCEALLYTLRLYDTVFHHHKKHFGKSLHDHKHGHGHKHVDHKHHSNHKTNNIDQKDTVEERRYLLSITNKTTLNSRNLAATSKKISSERISNKKKDVKEAFNVDSKGNTKSTGGTTKSSKVFQKVDQKVSQYQAIIEEVNKAIETAENSDVYLVRQLAQWVYRMNTSSYHDFPYDLTQSCPTGPFPVKHDSSASKSTRILQDSETDSENDKAETESESEVEFEGDATEPAQVCQHCRHQDIQLKHLPDILGIKLNLAKFNVSSRSLSSRTVKLKNGVLVPRLGFGCGMLGSDSEAEEAMYNAIKAGYRHFDTAQGYSKYIIIYSMKLNYMYIYCSLILFYYFNL